MPDVDNNMTSFSTLSGDAVLFIRDSLLQIAQKDVVFMQHADQVSLQQHNSKTIQFTRYPRLNLPKTPATDGVTPSSTALSVESVYAITDQWILVVTLTDLSEITVKHRLVPITSNLLGLAMAEIVDREIQKVLLGGTSVSFANGKTSRANLAAADVVNSVEARKQWVSLRNSGARPRGILYMAICDVNVSQDVGSEDQFHTAHELKDVTALYNNVIGTWMGFMWQVSNLIPSLTLIADADWTIAVAGSGTWAGGDNKTVYFKITAVDNEVGFEKKISNAVAAADVDDNEKVTITAPSTAGFTYNLYMASSNNTSTDSTLVLVKTGLTPSQAYVVTVDQTTFPTLATQVVGQSGITTAASTNPPASPPTGVTVHTTYFFGQEAYACVKLSGDNLRVLMTEAGKATDSDPAAQRRKISMKGSFKAVITNQNFVRRLESASAF